MSEDYSATATVGWGESIIVYLIIAVCVPLVLMSSCPLFHDKVTLPPIRSDRAKASVCTDVQDKLE
jgi:hypothetical protein